VTRFSGIWTCARSGLGVSFFGTWTWNRELTCAGYGSYLVAKRLPIPLLDEWRRQTMRSHIEPTKKNRPLLRQHRELILNCFRAQKLISSGAAKILTAFAPTACSNLPSIIHLASYPNPNLPMNSSDESKLW
jgi:hypothetical protein